MSNNDLEVFTESELKIAEDMENAITIAFPLFSRMISDLDIHPTRSIETLCTNGEYIKYNPDFVGSKQFRGQMFLMMHELGHIFLGHQLRYNPVKHKDKGSLQIAADYEVNAMLKVAGMYILPDAYLKHKFMDLCMEEIYDIICQDDNEEFDESSHGEVEQSPDVSDGEDDGGSSDMCGYGEGIGESEQKRQELIEKHNQKMKDSIQAARMAGGVSDDMERFFKKLYKTKNNWQDLLAAKLSKTIGRDDYTFSKPNRRYSGDFIMPGMYSEEVATVVEVIDTSGSINDNLLAKMSADVASLLEQCSPEKLIVMSCDTDIRSYEEFESGDEVKLHVRGGGGTSFNAPFERVKAEGIDPQVLVYLTDGYLFGKWPEDPGYPVIWVIWQDDREITPPFGDVIVMEGN